MTNQAISSGHLDQQQFSDLFSSITSDVQKTIQGHIGFTSTRQQTHAAMAALGAIAGLFIIQSQDLRDVMNRAIEKSIEQLNESETAQEAMALTRDGRPEEAAPELGLDGSAIAADANPASKHDPENRLSCAIRAAILKFYGGPVADEKRASELLDALARIVATATTDVGQQGIVFFADRFNAYLSAIGESRSVEGMTKQ